MRIGMLTGGGDAPGLNAVIRAVVRKATDIYGDVVVGFRNGWKGAIDGEAVTLTTESVRGILPRGGTILGSSRTNPFKVTDGVMKIKRTLESFKIDALIAIGGEDTLGVASKLVDEGFHVVGVPKTID
ncbi:MAG: 6-phosphofructokinase, partial [Actinomycetota bacterium]